MRANLSARHGSLLSQGSLGSIASKQAIGSIGSFRSIGSIGSAFSIGSIGSSFSIGSINSGFAIGQSSTRGNPPVEGAPSSEDDSLTEGPTRTRKVLASLAPGLAVVVGAWVAWTLMRRARAKRAATRNM